MLPAGMEQDSGFGRQLRDLQWNLRRHVQPSGHGGRAGWVLSRQFHRSHELPIGFAVCLDKMKQSLANREQSVLGNRLLTPFGPHNAKRRGQCTDRGCHTATSRNRRRSGYRLRKRINRSSRTV